MPVRCIEMTLPNGVKAVVRADVKVCFHCGDVSSRLCDFPVKGPMKKTCDRPLCERCAVHAEPDRDYCRVHAPMAPTGASK